MTGLDAARFERAITGTRIELAESLILNGRPVEAINYPTERRIVFSIPAVERLRGTQNFSVLVLHEYLGILAIDDRAYGVSAPLAARLWRSFPPESYRGGYDAIECKLFVNGQEIAGERSSAFHGVDLDQDAVLWLAYFTSGSLSGARRLFFRLEAVDRATQHVLARTELPASEALRASLILPAPSGARALHCWVHYR